MIFRFSSVGHGDSHNLLGRLLHRIPTLVLAAAAAAWSIDAGKEGVGAEIRSLPNIVIILADDMGFSDLGCYGSEILTPNLDRLAKGGLRFTQFYNCARCCPTRAALLTGLYPHQAGVGHMMNDMGRPGYRGNLNKECATIPEVLHTAGYQTMMCGKWHLTRFVGPEGPKHNWPLHRGFDKFYGTLHGAGSYFDPPTLLRDDRPMLLPERGEFYYTDAISDAAVQYVEQGARSGKPFFLYVAYTAPHWPLHAPSSLASRYRTKYALGWDEIRKERYQRQVALGIIKRQWPLTPRDERVRAWEQNPYKPWQQRRMEIYAAQVDALDQGVGRVLDKIRQVGAERNTLVMFLSDNGGCAEEVGSNWKGIHIPTKSRSGRPVQVGNNPDTMPGGDDTFQSYGMAWANVSNTPFRLYKHWVHEGGIATPLIVSWPAVIQEGGRMIHEPGHVIDIMATCLAATRVPYPEQLSGRDITPTPGKSLIPLLQGETRQYGPIFWEHEGNRAMRDGKWKLVSKYPGKWELFDLDADRTEMNNLAPRYPAIVKTMARAYDAWASQCNVEPWGE